MATILKNRQHRYRIKNIKNHHSPTKILKSAKTKKDYWLAAEGYARAGDINSVKDVLLQMTQNYKNAKRAWETLVSLEENIASSHTCNFTLDHIALSPFMKFRLAKGAYESNELKLLASNLEQDDCVIELGAGIGYIACHAMQFQPQLKGYTAVEANPSLISLIQKNQNLNQTSFNTIHGIACAEDGKAQFGITEDFWASSTYRANTDAVETISVNTFDLNKLIDRETANFLILDIEGGELELVPQINLSKITKVIIELHPSIIGNGGSSKVIRHLLDSGLNMDLRQSKADVFYFERDN